MKKAYLIKDNLPDFNGHASLYLLNEPLAEYAWGDLSDEDYEEPAKYNYVVCSSASILGMPETHIFGANNRGEIASWSFLPGSQKGSVSHEDVLSEAGYTLVVN